MSWLPTQSHKAEGSRNKSGLIKYNCEWKWNTMQMTVRDCEVMQCGQGMDSGVTE